MCILLAFYSHAPRSAVRRLLATATPALLLAAMPAAAITLDLQLLAGATGLSSPLALVDPGDGSGRLFIVEQAGTIRIWQSGALLATPLLTIPPGSISCCSERGLLGLAFHPDFASNGYFFVNYTEPEATNPPSCPTGAPCDQNTVIARFRVQSFVDPDNGDPNVADFSTEVRLLRYNQPYYNHNGGDLHFGPDGYLYVSSGDGGDSGDPQSYAQSTGTLLGKILRLDVDATPPLGHDLCGLSPQAYAAAPGNPYLGSAGCDEIWQLGLRNPWRFSFDRDTGDVWIGDVGQGSREEIDFAASGTASGANWGWRCYEGNAAYNTTGCGPSGDYRFPVHDYTQGSGRCAVTGGYRYRGSDHPELEGAYLFADYCTGEIWAATAAGGGSWTVSGPLYNASFTISSFGQDADGELYVLAYDTGAVYRLIETSVTPTPTATPTVTPTPTPTITPTPTPTPEPQLLDIDGNHSVAPLSDMLLILRWLFELRGDTLVAGAVGAGCARCDPAQIEPYLQSLQGQLDADDDGEEDALTDGILLLRWRLGFTGEALVAGAVSAQCQRCTAEAIASHLDGL